MGRTNPRTAFETVSGSIGTDLNNQVLNVRAYSDNAPVIQYAAGSAAETSLRFSGSIGESIATQSGSTGNILTASDKVIGCYAIPVLDNSPVNRGIVPIKPSSITLSSPVDGHARIDIDTTGRIVIITWHDTSA